jgi:hypothetical protein
MRLSRLSRKASLSLLPLLIALPVSAQTPPPPPAPAPPPANSPFFPGGGGTNNAPSSADPASAGPGALFDNRLPGVDPGTGMVRFNGQTWNLTNNKLLAARFEKFLNTPEESGDLEKEHREILNRMLAMLDPNHLTANTLSEAYRLLNRAATFPGDARLCDTLSGSIYAVWQSKRNQGRLTEANRILEEERARSRDNMVSRLEFAAGKGKGSSYDPSSTLAAPPPGGTAPPQASNNPAGAGGGAFSVQNGTVRANTNTNSNSQANAPQRITSGPQSSATPAQVGLQTAATSVSVGGYAEKLVNNAAKIKINEVKAELSELQAKIEFQSTLVQLFFQRRFHHLLIGTRFYRALFSDGDSKLNLPDQSAKVFGSGSPPTISSLEALANEAMRDVQTSVQAFHRFIDTTELDSATKRLTEAFLIGEYMPELRTLPWERKRKVLAYSQKANMLLSALETKDYTLASELIHGPQGLKAMARDFDPTKPNALIETSRNSARLLLAKARNAALSNDKPAFEAALKEAASIWPNNPELTEVATKAFNQGDVQAQALNELNQLIAQKNFRRIAEEAGRFLAATHLAPAEKQAELKAILDDFKSIEAALMGALEMDRQGNPFGAWESVEKLIQKFPDDIQLVQARALYTTRAAEFVRTIQNAQDHERKTQPATSLAWFLKAQRLYPNSTLAKDAIARLKSQLLSGQTSPEPTSPKAAASSL